MKILICSCLFLCLAAVYGENEEPGKPWDPVEPPPCERIRGHCVRVYFDELPPTTTADGLTSYYFNCYLYQIFDTECRQIRDCPIREPYRSAEEECCRPDIVQYVTPTLYCRYARTYNCRRNAWTWGPVNGPVQHPIVKDYIYRYVPSCSCHNCHEWIPEEVKVPEAETEIDRHYCEKTAEFQMHEDHADHQEPRPC